MNEGDARSTRASAAGALLAPDNCALMLIDYESQMFFGVQSTDRQLLINNTVGLAKAAKVFGLPTLVTTVTEKTFSGPMVPVTWLRVMLELQRDWGRQETAMEVQKVAAEHAGAYGQGMRYVMEMFASGTRAS